MNRAAQLIACSAALAACGEPAAAPDAAVDAAPDAGPEYQPGLPVVVTADRPGPNQTPALLRGRHDDVFLAWSSDGDLYFSHSADGAHWTVAAPAGVGIGDDSEPTLYQDEAGIIHLAWSRAGKIMYAHATSPDSVAEWAAVSVTAADLGDAAPSLTATPAGDLVIAFARTSCSTPCGIFATRSTDGGASWGTPVPVSGGEAGVKHHLPSIANIGGELVIAWNEYADSASVPWESLDTRPHLMTIRSGATGLWTAKSELTPVTAGHIVFPTFYADQAGAWHVAYVRSFDVGNGLVSEVREIPFATPTAMAQPLPIFASRPRIVATSTPKVYLGAWEDGRNILVRVYERE